MSIDVKSVAAGAWRMAPGVLVLAILWPVAARFIDQRSTESWLLPHLLIIWSFTLLFAVACLSTGLLIVRRLTLDALPRDGHAPIAFAVGVVAFAIAQALLGFAHLLGAVSFWALPLMMIAVGLNQLISFLRETWKTRRWSPLEALFFVVGVIGLLVVAIPIIEPGNTDYDARWYHLGMAERYAVEGGITRSNEGDNLLTGPQLASWLYTWAFQSPRELLYDRVVLALHLELACFVGTLAAIPALTRSLAPTLPPVVARWSWVAMFSFPALYVYDTGLMGGGEHVVALFVPLAVLAWLQASERNDQRSFVLFGVALGALVLAKYTAVIIAVPLVLIASIRTVWKLRSIKPLLITALVTIVVAAPYWLRNLVWYGNPIYPVLPSIFPSTPWTVDSTAWALRHANEMSSFVHQPLFERLRDTLAALWNYHLATYTWNDFTLDMPVFGSLYAVSLVALPFIRERRLWLAALIIHLAIAIWFNLAHTHQMRFLIILVPVMVSAAVATFARLWLERDFFVRGAVCVAVFVQVAFASDVPFLPTHRLNGHVAPMVKGLQFISRGPQEHSVDRFVIFEEWAAIGRIAPKDATLLLHGSFAHLGIGRKTVTDVPGQQYGMNYSDPGSVAGVLETWHRMGITHTATYDSADSYDSVTGELLFRAALDLGTTQIGRYNAWVVATVNAVPSREPGTGVFYSGCGKSYATGLYALSALRMPRPGMNDIVKWAAPDAAGAEPALIARATYAVIEEGCPSARLDGFRRIGTHIGWPVNRQFWLRN